MNINGESQSIITNKIISNDGSADISLNDDVINLEADSVLVNGAPIGTGGGFVTNPLSTTLDGNEYSINNVGSVQATLFIKNGGTSEQYLMADGSALKYSANSGNSNFYLYNSVTNQSPTPVNGDISYNATEQKQATVIYISHRTRDNIDIEVFFKNISTLNDVYIQDQENSDNNITYNIIGPPTIVTQAQITIPVSWTSSSGTGTVSFGNGHNVLLSFFTNSIETDTRITTLETKTQNQTANAGGTTFNKDTTCLLREADGDYFLVGGDGGDLKFIVGTTSISANKTIFMLNNIISGLGNPVANTDAANKTYVDTVLGGGGGLAPYFRQLNQILNITTAGLSETIFTISPSTFGSYSWADATIGQSRKWTIRGVQNRGTFSGIYTLRIKTGATLTDTFVIPAQGPGAVTNQPFILEILQVRTGANSLAFYMNFNTVNTGTTGYAAYYTNTNATTGVQGLGVSTAYTLTLQSSIASCSLTITYIEVTAMLK